MNLTTDSYIDKFFPFSILKQVGAMLCEVLPEEQSKHIKKLQITKMRELYRSLICKENHETQTATFKQNMIELIKRLKEKFPNLDPLIAKQKVKPLDEDVDFEEFDNISSENQKLLKAIHILTGSEIEMHPEIKERILNLEANMKKCDVACTEISFVAKALTKDDGELNL